MKTKSKTSGYIIRSAAYAALFLCAIVAFTSAISLPNRSTGSPWAYSAAGIAPSRNIVGTPTLGNYPDTSIPLSTDTTVTPDAAPTNTTSINVSTSTSFNGTLEGDPATGVVRVMDAHPAGT